MYKTLTAEEQRAVLELDSIKEFKKGDLLIAEGKYPKGSFFVVKGIVRKFRNIDGEDVTSDFYTDGQSILSIGATANPLPSKFSLECLEDSKISVVSFEKELEMYERFPRFEKMCRIATEENLVKFQEAFANYISSSPEQRYLNLLNNKPELIDRVPQYHLASYLGVKPESLSRIRKRVANKKI